MFRKHSARKIHEIASVLNLFPKTVETYINRAKLKTGFNVKSQLVFFQNLS